MVSSTGTPRSSSSSACSVGTGEAPVENLLPRLEGTVPPAVCRATAKQVTPEDTALGIVQFHLTGRCLREEMGRRFVPHGGDEDHVASEVVTAEGTEDLQAVASCASDANVGDAVEIDDGDEVVLFGREGPEKVDDAEEDLHLGSPWIVEAGCVNEEKVVAGRRCVLVSLGIKSA
jgi:hypothetical protein